MPAPSPSSAAPERPLEAGGATRIGPFQLVRQLGRGGFAPVWLADEIYDGKKLRDVAVKLFRLPDDIAPASDDAARWRDQIIDEARALCRVEHPNVVRFYSLQQDDARGVIGLAMEYVAGDSLDVRLRTAGPLAERLALDLGISIAWALSAVHNAGLVHRDIKPANIIEGASGYKLIDFGIVAQDARAPHERGEVAAAPGPLVGTLGYIAPECFEHGAPPSAASDLFALGVTLFELLTGVLPGRGAVPLSATAPFDPHTPPTDAPYTPPTGDPGLPAPGASIEAHAHADPRASTRGGPTGRPPELTPELSALLTRLLDPDANARPRHADWVARELERVRAQRATPEAPAPTDDPTDRWATQPASPSRELARDPGPRLVDRAAGPTTDPARAELCPHPPLLGRDGELEVLDRAVDEARRGRLQVVVITGPLGVGRTRLLEAAIERAAVRRGRCLLLQCSPERPSLLRPLRRAIDALPDESAEALAILDDAVEQAISPTALRGAGAGDGERREGPIECVEDALLWLSAREPLLLAIDDLQWGDAYTLELVRLLVERAGAGGAAHLLVVATARNEPNPTPPLRALLNEVRGRVRPAARHIDLGPLSAAWTAAVAQAVGPLSPALEQAVVRGSGHVPFFIVHALLVWREGGALLFRDGAWHPRDDRVLREPVPEVGALVEARIASYLDPASGPGRVALRALAVVALYGGGLGSATLFRVCGDEENLELALEALIEAGILTLVDEPRDPHGPRDPREPREPREPHEPHEYGFAQEMVRQAALNRLRRRPWFNRLHRALLDAIAAGSSAPLDAVFLATGYEKLGAVDEARRWLARAMDGAAAAGLFAEAAELGDRLAALTGDDGDPGAPVGARRGVELEVVRALLRGRRFEEARRRLERIEARARVFPATRGAATELRARIYRLEAAQGVDDAGVDDPTLVADADALGDATLRCEARAAVAGGSPEERAMELISEAVELSSRCAPAVEFAARVRRFELNHAASRRDLHLAERDLRRAADIAAATSSVWHKLHIEGDLAVIEAELGQTGAAVARLRRLVTEAEARGMLVQLRICLLNLSVFLMRGGEAAEAGAVAARTARLAEEAGDPTIRASALSVRADALRRTGDLDAALTSAAEAAEIQRERGDRMLALTLLRRAEILGALGRVEEAMVDARAAREAAEQRGDRRLTITARLWETLHRAQRGEATREALERALEEATAPGFGLQAMTRSLIERATAWLAAGGAKDRA